MRANIHGDVQEATRVIPEIEDQGLHAALLQFIERLAQLFGGRLVKLNQANVTDLELAAQLRVQKLGPLDALDFYLRPFQGEIFDLLGRGAQNGQRYFLPWSSAKEIDRILQFHFLG